jgi:hypothetical protein
VDDVTAVPPKGWYPDPAGGTQWRFWTGSAWTPNTVAWPARLSGPDIVALGRQAWLARWILGPSAVAFTVALMDTIIHSAVDASSTVGEFVLLLYPVAHIVAVRSLGLVSRIYRIRRFRIVPWLPLVGPLMWWSTIARVGSAPVWSRFAPLWLFLSLSGTMATDFYLRLASAGAWLAGCLGVWVVTKGFAEAVRTDTLPPVAP